MAQDETALATVPTHGKAYSWYLQALKEHGPKPRLGMDENPNIVGYLRSLTSHGTDDDISWASAFVNHCLVSKGYVGTNSARAYTWEHWANESPLVCGAVVVVTLGLRSRVGFFVREDEYCVWLLGANDDNSVSKSSYAKSRVVAVRMPTLNAKDAEIEL